MTYRPFLTLSVLCAIGLVVGAGVLAVQSGGDAGLAAVPGMGTDAPAPTGRTVLLERKLQPAARSHANLLDATLVRGRMPHRTSYAVVLSDADCAPDARGVSHCLDRLRLADGRLITVRHVHDMRSTRCLTPGERVRLVPAKRLPA